jgi:hypothetical protein
VIYAVHVSKLYLFVCYSELLTVFDMNNKFNKITDIPLKFKNP